MCLPCNPFVYILILFTGNVNAFEIKFIESDVTREQIDVCFMNC